MAGFCCELLPLQQASSLVGPLWYNNKNEKPHNEITLIVLLLLRCSDGWNTRQDVVENQEEGAKGSFSVQLASPSYKPFESHYLSLKPTSNTMNPWFREFWEDRFKCSFKRKPGTTPCTG